MPFRFAPSILSLVMVLAVAFVGGCKTLSDLAAGATKPGLAVRGVRFGDIGTDGMTMYFDTEVSNPYSIDLPLANLDYTLASKGTQFLTGSSPMQGTVPANGRKVVALPAKIAFGPMLSVLQGVKPGAVVPYAADMKLSVDGPAGVGRLVLPLSKSGDLPVPAVPDVSVADLKMGALSLNNTKATLLLNVKNTNQFAVNLARMGLGLELAGSEVSSATVTNALSLKPGESGTIEVPMNLSLTNLGLSAFNALRGKDTGYRLKGDVTIDTPFGPMMLPLDRGGTTKVKN